MIDQLLSHDNRFRAEGISRCCREKAHTPSISPKRNVRSWKSARGNIRHRIATSFEPRLFCSPLKVCPMMSSLRAWTLLVKSLVNGDSGFTANGCRGWTKNPGADGRPVFPPNIAVEVKAIACQLPHERELPLSRLSLSEIRREVIKQGVVASISKATLWRWLSQDAIQPWRYRTWL